MSSLTEALDVLGDPWAFLILREAFFGVRRFEVFQRQLGISRTVLASRLSLLAAEGVLARHAYSERPPRDEYRLTAAGRAFYPSIVALMTWGDRWTRPAQRPPLSLTHRLCGNELVPVLVCGACSRAIARDEVGTRHAENFDEGAVQLARGGATRRARSDDAFTIGRPCSVARALAIAGDRWTFRMLAEAFAGADRFDELARRLAMPRNTLTERLTTLTEAGIFARTVYRERPLRYRYALTAAGEALWPATVLLTEWGERFRADKVSTVLHHDSCGQRLDARLVCGACRQEVRAVEVDYVMHYRFPGGPGAD